jgi:F-type H+-transporting ATPase subunit delta
VNHTNSARRYAKALIETASDPKAVRDELIAVEAALNANPALLGALANPGVPAANKKAIFSAVFAGLQMPLPRLFEMLIDASRLELLPEVVRLYRVQWNARNNVHAAKVVSAFVLDDEAASHVRKALENTVAGTVEMETSVDPTLLGGLKVEVDGYLFDGSAKARLKALRQHLL